MARELILLLALLIPAELFARDINLDNIYLRRDSPLARRLPIVKLDVYQSAQSQLVGRGVVFAGWLSGLELFYIQEVPELSTNILFLYKPSRRHRIEQTRIPGVITAVRSSSDGSFIALKRLIQKDDPVPKGETLIYSFRSGKKTILPSPTGFLDFNIPENSPSIVYEAPEGMVEYYPSSGQSKLLMKKRTYSGTAARGSTSIALPSPDRRHTLVLSGGAGDYSARVFGERTDFAVPGISSASETFWLDSHTLAFRVGFPGAYSVRRYDIRKKASSTLLASSFNTSITYSSHPSTLSFLREQVICLYDVRSAKTFITGLEGEDVHVAPNGESFVSILNGRLFINNSRNIKKNELALRRSWQNILAAYRELALQKRHWENQYSLDYIRRKISLYSSLTDG